MDDTIECKGTLRYRYPNLGPKSLLYPPTPDPKLRHDGHRYICATIYVIGSLDTVDIR